MECFSIVVKNPPPNISASPQFFALFRFSLAVRRLFKALFPALMAALPYLIGGTVGGWLGGRWFRGVRVVWLRRAFGLLLLYGGARCLL